MLDLIGTGNPKRPTALFPTSAKEVQSMPSLNRICSTGIRGKDKDPSRFAGMNVPAAILEMSFLFKFLHLCCPWRQMEIAQDHSVAFQLRI
jgi:hypothetical protein